MDDSQAIQLFGDQSSIQNGLVAVEQHPMLQSRPYKLGEDWTGTTNPSVRRKLQNRINQRACRNRKNGLRPRSEEKVQVDDNGACSAVEMNTPSASTASYHFIQNLSESLQGFISLPPADEYANEVPNEATTSSTVVTVRAEQSSNRNPNISPSAYRKIMLARDFNAWLSHYQRRNITPFSADHLLTLMAFNVIRAHSSNSLLLGLVPELIADDAISPFNDNSPLTIGLPKALPPSLQPTSIQKRIKHHPEADMFPFPRLRDNMILAEGEFNDYEFCEDLVGVACRTTDESSFDGLGALSSTVENAPPHTGPGLIVWSDPWRPESWEISESFARKWGWLFAGCKELLESTNDFREKRGEEALVWEV